MRLLKDRSSFFLLQQKAAQHAAVLVRLEDVSMGHGHSQQLGRASNASTGLRVSGSTKRAAMNQAMEEMAHGTISQTHKFVLAKIASTPRQLTHDVHGISYMHGTDKTLSSHQNFNSQKKGNVEALHFTLSAVNAESEMQEASNNKPTR